MKRRFAVIFLILIVFCNILHENVALFGGLFGGQRSSDSDQSGPIHKFKTEQSAFEKVQTQFSDWIVQSGSPIRKPQDNEEIANRFVLDCYNVTKKLKKVATIFEKKSCKFYLECRTLPKGEERCFRVCTMESGIEIKINAYTNETEFSCENPQEVFDQSCKKFQDQKSQRRACKQIMNNKENELMCPDCPGTSPIRCLPDKKCQKKLQGCQKLQGNFERKPQYLVVEECLKTPYFLH